MGAPNSKISNLVSRRIDVRDRPTTANGFAADVEVVRAPRSRTSVKCPHKESKLVRAPTAGGSVTVISPIGRETVGASRVMLHIINVVQVAPSILCCHHRR